MKKTTLTIRNRHSTPHGFPARYGIYRGARLVGHLYPRASGTRIPHWVADSIDTEGQHVERVQTEFGARAENGWKGRGFFVLRRWILAHPESFPVVDSA